MKGQPKWLLAATSVAILLVAAFAALLNRPPGSTRIAHGAGLTATSAVSTSTPAPAATIATATPTVQATSTGTPTSVAAAPGSMAAAPATPATAGGQGAGTPAATPATPAYPRFACQPPPSNGYATCLFTESPGMTMTFYLFVPANYDPHQKYPLVLLLEGGGERSSASKTLEQNRQLLLTDPYAEVWGPGYPGPDDPGVQKHWPSFIVLPQVEGPADYVSVPANVGSYTLPPQPTDSLRMAKEIVDDVRTAYSGVDSSRLYVTGLSMGGYGAWEMIERWPHEFAAAAPICGAGDPSRAAALVNLPIWAFHSADDPIVPVSGSRDMIAAIRTAGGHPRYTEYTNVGHGAWVDAYSILGKPSPTPDFYAWLFAQRKASPSP